MRNPISKREPSCASCNVKGAHECPRAHNEANDSVATAHDPDLVGALAVYGDPGIDAVDR